MIICGIVWIEKDGNIIQIAIVATLLLGKVKYISVPMENMINIVIQWMNAKEKVHYTDYVVVDKQKFHFILQVRTHILWK